MKYISTLIVSCLVFVVKAQLPQTPFEISEGRQTGTYEEVIAFYQKLAQQESSINIKQMSLTDSGLPLHLVTLDTDQDFDFKKSYDKGKTIILINNGIHPGEPDGIEACMMLLRDYAQFAEKRGLINSIVIAVIPIYNIGGALNRNSFTRVNQDGPEEYGFRGNARNYDLNRDFIKADTRNTKSFYEIFQLVNPDIFIDTHVSNGADYQYSITHLITQHNKMGGEMSTYINNTFTPGLEQEMLRRKVEITPYVNVYNTTPDSEGFSQFFDSPRYSTGFATLFNTLGLMIETHMLKTFDVRVKSTYTLLESIIAIAKKDGATIRDLKNRRNAEFKSGIVHPVDWRLTRAESTELNFKGYEGEKVTSAITGQERLNYNRKKPFTKTIPYYNSFVPTSEVIVPKAYVIPQGWYNVIDLLKANNIQYQQVKADTTIEVEVYQIEKYNTSKTAYEGHYPNNSATVLTKKENIRFRSGDFIFEVGSHGGRFLVETLEPTATDSYFNWNFFDTILQQKEGFSPYVFEDLAKQLIDAEPELRKAFNKKKKEEPDFNANWYAQLDYIYKNSPYYEQAFMQYPVFRIVE